MKSRIPLLVVTTSLFTAACGGTFCEEFPEACGSVGGGGGGEPAPETDGVLQSGAILCADCAASPFCYDVTRTVFVYRSDPADACPPDLLPSQPATRRAVNGGSQTFHCVPPNDEDDFNLADTWCDGPLVDYSAVDECGADADAACSGDPCLNDECATEHGQIVTTCGKDLASAGTPNELFASASVAQEKIIDAAAGYHQLSVPGNPNADPTDPDEPPPDRYCFVTCFDESLYTSPVACDPADDPWVSATSTMVAIEPGSEAEITLNTTDEFGRPQSTTSSIDVEGAIAIDVPKACRNLGDGAAVTCNVEIGSVLLKGEEDIVVQGFDVSKLAVINRMNWSATATASEAMTTILLDSAPALVTALVNPFGRFGVHQDLAGLSGVLNWKDRTYESTATFRGVLGDGSSAKVTVTGTIPNIPPEADAGSDLSFECTGDGRASVTLTASAADADGIADLASFMWSRNIHREWTVSSGPTLTAAFPLGNSDVILTASDSAGAEDMDGVEVTVVDSRDPVIVDVEVSPGSLWPADGRLHLIRLGQELRTDVTDACDSSPTVSIVDVSGSGDIEFGDGAICIRAAATGSPNPLRNYTVTVEASDASGNWTERDVVITNASFAPAVADDDPRCP